MPRLAIRNIHTDPDGTLRGTFGTRPVRYRPDYSSDDGIDRGCYVYDDVGGAIVKILGDRDLYNATGQWLTRISYD